MKISDLKSGKGSVNITGSIKEIEEPRRFNKFGRELVVANAFLEDDSGSVKLTLWNDDSSKFKAGDVVKIENGYVNEFQGELQLTAGKFGKIEKVSPGDGKETSTEDDSGEELVEEIEEVLEE
jgi:replication factor A1